jgi:hypothetical protein
VARQVGFGLGPRRTGSTPAASTNFSLGSADSVLISRRLQYFSTTRSIVGSGFSRTIEQPNRSIERGRTQVHVALRHVQVLVPGQFLDCPCGRATHRQMRADVWRRMWTPSFTFARIATRRIVTCTTFCGLTQSTTECNDVPRQALPSRADFSQPPPPCTLRMVGSMLRPSSQAQLGDVLEGAPRFQRTLSVDPLAMRSNQSARS